LKITSRSTLEPVDRVMAEMAARGRDPDPLGLDEQFDQVADRAALDPLADQVDAAPPQSGIRAVGCGDARAQAVRRADEAGDEPGRRAVIDLELGADLLDPALVHHRDAIGQGQRLLLIVGDVNERNTELLLEAPHLDLHLAAQLAVEIGERFVEEQQRGAGNQAPGERDALLLAAGQLMRCAAPIR
jgi:hypothetical protein